MFGLAYARQSTVVGTFSRYFHWLILYDVSTLSPDWGYGHLKYPIYRRKKMA